MQFICSSVRPSRSACLRPAAINRSISTVPTTRPSIRVSAVNVADFCRPQATATTMSSTAPHAARSACATASRTACSASYSSKTVPLFIPRDAHTPEPSTRTSTCLRLSVGRACGTATITQTVLLVPTSKRPMTSSACRPDPRLVPTSRLHAYANACSRAAGHHLRRRGPALLAGIGITHQRTFCNPEVDLARRPPQRARDHHSPCQRLCFAFLRQLQGAAVGEPKHPAPPADALGELHLPGERGLAGEQREQVGGLCRRAFARDARQRGHGVARHGRENPAGPVDQKMA